MSDHVTLWYDDTLMKFYVERQSFNHTVVSENLTIVHKPKLQSAVSI